MEEESRRESFMFSRSVLPLSLVTSLSLSLVISLSLCLLQQNVICHLASSLSQRLAQIDSTAGLYCASCAYDEDKRREEGEGPALLLHSRISILVSTLVSTLVVGDLSSCVASTEHLAAFLHDSCLVAQTIASSDSRDETHGMRWEARDSFSSSLFHSHHSHLPSTICFPLSFSTSSRPLFLGKNLAPACVSSFPRFLRSLRPLLSPSVCPRQFNVYLSCLAFACLPLCTYMNMCAPSLSLS